MKHYIHYLGNAEMELYRFLCTEKTITLEDYIKKRGITRKEAMVVINNLKRKGLLKVKYNPKIIVVDG